ncbi:hypothetical protein IGL98_001167 [Enterococcus sp. DIV0840]|uniref:CHY-type domain-containing protein n=1 Tax=Enterococcus ureasiticus TaxID=903984 RepID=A0A1E5GNE8_9ENTE|nr:MULTISPECIES: CHY zinc finger protein [Enterococcus]MBO0434619.1 hypothetical protein [Enterococcus sp. DIV0849a]MBO0475233.1 hypothetical protein [Enterococcus ureasiticus]OEG14217.1 hypothetical protein BCR21_04305 [Enterococcus ureasiticus]
MKEIFGLTVDEFGRCVHYNLSEDVVANKCYNCKKYYACYRCHNKLEKHVFLPWPISKKNTDKVVLCGACQYEMTYVEYKEFNKCPNCDHLFNLNCINHLHYYFSFKE